ncbi:MAG: hypothetical protein M0019_05970 [Actinomycetota bacterium]|nr:hypothetical protein [Actinomycetota bacterium]
MLLTTVYKYLDRAVPGDAVDVNGSGPSVVPTTSPSKGDTEFEELVASGQLIPATTQFQIPQNRITAVLRERSGIVLSELRQERFE